MDNPKREGKTAHTRGALQNFVAILDHAFSCLKPHPAAAAEKKHEIVVSKDDSPSQAQQHIDQTGGDVEPGTSEKIEPRLEPGGNVESTSPHTTTVEAVSHSKNEKEQHVLGGVGNGSTESTLGGRNAVALQFRSLEPKVTRPESGALAPGGERTIALEFASFTTDVPATHADEAVLASEVEISTQCDGIKKGSADSDKENLDVEFSSCPAVELESASVESQNELLDLPTRKDIALFYKHQRDLFFLYNDEGRLFQSIKYLNELEITLENCLKRYENESPSASQQEEIYEAAKHHLKCIEENEAMQLAKVRYSSLQKIMAMFHLDFMKPNGPDPQFVAPDVNLQSLPLMTMNSEEISNFNEAGKMYSMRSRSFLPQSSLDAGPEPQKASKKRNFHFRRHFSKGIFRKVSKKQFSHLSKNNELLGWTREKGKYIDIAYKCEKNQSVSVRVRGKLSSEYVQVLAVLRETDLAYNWAPFLKESVVDHAYDSLTQVLRQVYEYPLLGMNESLSFAFAINALQELGCVLILSVNASDVDSKYKETPQEGTKKKKLQRARATDLCFFLYPRNNGKKTTLEMYANMVHGQSIIPARMVAYFVKLVAKGMFTSITKVCQSFEEGPYVERVKNQPQFYDWVNRLLKSFYLKEQSENIKLIEQASLNSFYGEQYE